MFFFFISAALASYYIRPPFSFLQKKGARRVAPEAFFGEPDAISNCFLSFSLPCKPPSSPFHRNFIPALTPATATTTSLSPSFTSLPSHRHRECVLAKPQAAAVEVVHDFFSCIPQTKREGEKIEENRRPPTASVASLLST